MVAFDANKFLMTWLLGAPLQRADGQGVSPVFEDVRALSAPYCWAKFPTRFGQLLAVLRGQVLVYLGFCDDSAPMLPRGLDRLPLDEAEPQRVAALLVAVQQAWSEQGALVLAVAATPFQQSVWRYLCQVNSGEVWTYGRLATAMERPKAVRAVASAVGANPFAVVIPCHRVCRADGGLGGYRWGVTVKQHLLDFEAKAEA